MAIDRGLNDTVSTNPLGIDDDDYQATTRGPQGVKGDDGDITTAYVNMYDSVVADEAAAAVSATNAAASAVTSAAKATTATTNAVNAALSETAAELSETNSATSETNAASSATNSASSAATASTAETNASTSATNAATSASTATTKAATATTQATASASSASASAVSATAAQSSEDDAATSETNAATSETNAATSATASATSATASASSATSSASSATSATASASTATTKATSATTSEANALTYKNAAVAAQTAAETAETNAETAETNAETAETNAETAETNSATSATASATSATASASSASSSATSATAAATSATNAASSLTTFQGQYVSQSTAPSSPSTGDLWFDTSSSTMKVYNGAGWTNAGSSVNGVENSVEYTATSGQTTFSATYDAGYLQVFLNGIRLDAADYTATNGSSVVLDTGATTGDTVFIHSFGTFALADHYNKTASDARYAQTANHYTKTAADTLLAAKVDDSQVLTDVPSGALFTDTIYTLPSGIATETYVGTEISNLVDSSPAALNTLNELAAAMGDDANHVTTMTNLIGAKLSTAGGTMTGDLELGDNVKAKFGASDDLQIYHDGNDSYITDTGTGLLFIRGSSGVRIQGANGENGITLNENASADLYYDNSKKLATTSSGVDISGTVVADTLGVESSTEFLSYVKNAAQQPWYQKVSTSSNKWNLHLNGTGDILTADSSGIDVTGGIVADHHVNIGTGMSFQWGDSHERIEQSDGNIEFFTDNSEKMRLSGGNVLVGKTTSNSGVVGVELSGGAVVCTTSGAEALLLNRLSSDGDISVFRKDGSTVGSIGVTSGSLGIGQSNTGLGFFNTDNIVFPATSTGATRDNAIDLGYTGGRFKDLYLSGSAHIIADGATGNAWTYHKNDDQTWLTGCRGTDADSYTIYDLTADEARLTIDTSGNVGMTGASQVRLSLGSEGTAGTNTCNWIRGNAGYLQFNSATSGFNWEVGGTNRMSLSSSGTVTATAFVGDGSGLTNLPSSGGLTLVSSGYESLNNSTTRYLSGTNQVGILFCTWSMGGRALRIGNTAGGEIIEGGYGAYYSTSVGGGSQMYLKRYSQTQNVNWWFYA